MRVRGGGIVVSSRELRYQCFMRMYTKVHKITTYIDISLYGTVRTDEYLNGNRALKER